MFYLKACFREKQIKTMNCLYGTSLSVFADVSNCGQVAMVLLGLLNVSKPTKLNTNKPPHPQKSDESAAETT